MRSTSRYSSIRAPRSRKGTPSMSNSSVSQPAATPTSTRPPDSTSSVASSLARTTGWRYGRTITEEERRMRRGSGGGGGRGGADPREGLVGGEGGGAPEGEGG